MKGGSGRPNRLFGFQITPILAFPRQGGRDIGLDQECPFLSQKTLAGRAISSFPLDGGRPGWG